VTRYVLDPERSEVRVEGRSSIHPIRAAAPARGELDVSGPAGWLEVAVGELRTGNPLYDREIRRRLDARRQPTLGGHLEGLTALEGDRFTAAGTVTVHGVERQVDGELAIREDPDGTVTITGERRFDIRDFGLEAPRVLALRVEPEVTVRVNAMGRAEPEGRPAPAG
jgi:hypothetical protein